MDRNLKERVFNLVSRVAEDCRFELVDMKLSAVGRKTSIRVDIDKDGGITLDECAVFSRRLEAFMDVEDPVPGSYILEVSSPGLDRPLKRLEDFEKCRGRLVRIATKEMIDNQSFFTGRISGVSGETLKLTISGKKGVLREIDIPCSIVSKANLEVEIG